MISPPEGLARHEAAGRVRLPPDVQVYGLRCDGTRCRDHPTIGRIAPPVGVRVGTCLTGVAVQRIVRETDGLATPVDLPQYLPVTVVLERIRVPGRVGSRRQPSECVIGEPVHLSLFVRHRPSVPHGIVGDRSG